MAGFDYAGFAFCPKTKEWTKSGYIKHKQVLFDFHKNIDETFCDVMLEPAGEAFLQTPGIGTVQVGGETWWFVYGYRDHEVDDDLFLWEWLRKNKYMREAEMLSKIIKGKCSGLRQM